MPDMPNTGGMPPAVTLNSDLTEIMEDALRDQYAAAETAIRTARIAQKVMATAWEIVSERVSLDVEYEWVYYSGTVYPAHKKSKRHE